MSFSYNTYLKLDPLLSQQQPLSDEHDETLFVIIHQVYELWFKQILHELGFLQRNLEANQQATALHTLKRILTILKTLVAQVDILETMTPLSFASFRPRLEHASGFQSRQFRELEIVLGKRDLKMLQQQPPESQAMLEARLQQPSLYTSFLRFLYARGLAVPTLLLEPTLEIRESPEVQQLLVEIYRSDPATAELCERLIDLDEGFGEWRYRHARMVERTIGTKPGTGGSSGSAYLRTTLFKPFFPDLWAIRICF